MEPAHTKVEIGRFQVIAVELGAVRISLGQGVNAWIHMNFIHGVKVGDTLPLFTEIRHAPALTAPVE